MTDETIALFDRWAAEGAADALESSHGDVVRQVLDAIGIRPGERVLDLGCGTGWATREIARRAPGVQAVGVDASPGMIRRAEELHSYAIRARYDLARFEELGLPDASFDRAFSMEALYYATDPDRALAELFRVLKPGGTVDVVIDFHADSPATRAWSEAMGVPMTWRSADEWKAAFERAGFVGVETRRVVDRRGPGDPAAFRPSTCFPDWASKEAAHRAGSLWIHAEKPRT